LLPTYKCSSKHVGGFKKGEDRFVTFKPDLDLRIEPYTVVFPRLKKNLPSLRKAMTEEIDSILFQILVEEDVEEAMQKIQPPGGGSRFSLDVYEMALIEGAYPHVGYLLRDTYSDPSNGNSYIPCDGPGLANDYFYCSGDFNYRAFVLPSIKGGRFTFMEAGGWVAGDKDGPDDAIANGTCTAYYD
jgi:hypothetical protein